MQGEIKSIYADDMTSSLSNLKSAKWVFEVLKLLQLIQGYNEDG